MAIPAGECCTALCSANSSAQQRILGFSNQQWERILPPNLDFWQSHRLIMIRSLPFLSLDPAHMKHCILPYCHMMNGPSGKSSLVNFVDVATTSSQCCHHIYDRFSWGPHQQCLLEDSSVPIVLMDRTHALRSWPAQPIRTAQLLLGDRLTHVEACLRVLKPHRSDASYQIELYSTQSTRYGLTL